MVITLIVFNTNISCFINNMFFLLWLGVWTNSFQCGNDKTTTMNMAFAQMLAYPGRRMAVGSMRVNFKYVAEWSLTDDDPIGIALKLAAVQIQSYLKQTIRVNQEQLIFNIANCQDVAVPASDQNVPFDFDLFIYSRTSTQGIFYANTSPCLSRASVPKRTVLGRVSWNLVLLKDATSQRGWQNNLRILLHGMYHIMGFTSELVSQYVNPAIVTVVGPLTYITSPSVLRQVKAYYGCPTAVGMPIEDGPVAGQWSHWEKDFLLDELMVGEVAFVDNMWISSITLSLLLDTGWYEFVSFQFSEQKYMGFGKGRGCNFLSAKSCSVQPQYCTTDGVTFYNRAIGQCLTDRFMACKARLSLNTGKCQDPGYLGIDGVNAKTFQLGGFHSYAFESTISAQAFTLTTSFRCYPAYCQGTLLRVRVGNFDIRCMDGAKVQDPTRYNGYLMCPASIAAFCLHQMVCQPDGCIGKYMCVDGICLDRCLAGYYFITSCQKCKPECQTCVDGQSCKVCAPNYCTEINIRLCILCSLKLRFNIASIVQLSEQVVIDLGANNQTLLTAINPKPGDFIVTYEKDGQTIAQSISVDAVTFTSTGGVALVFNKKLPEGAYNFKVIYNQDQLSGQTPAILIIKNQNAALSYVGIALSCLLLIAGAVFRGVGYMYNPVLMPQLIFLFTLIWTPVTFYPDTFFFLRGWSIMDFMFFVDMLSDRVYQEYSDFSFLRIAKDANIIRNAGIPFILGLAILLLIFLLFFFARDRFFIIKRVSLYAYGVMLTPCLLFALFQFHYYGRNRVLQGSATMGGCIFVGMIVIVMTLIFYFAHFLLPDMDRPLQVIKIAMKRKEEKQQVDQEQESQEINQQQSSVCNQINDSSDDDDEIDSMSGHEKEKTQKYDHDYDHKNDRSHQHIQEMPKSMVIVATSLSPEFIVDSTRRILLIFIVFASVVFSTNARYVLLPIQVANVIVTVLLFTRWEIALGICDLLLACLLVFEIIPAVIIVICPSFTLIYIIGLSIYRICQQRS